MSSRALTLGHVEAFIAKQAQVISIMFSGAQKEDDISTLSILALFIFYFIFHTHTHSQGFDCVSAFCHISNTVLSCQSGFLSSVSIIGKKFCSVRTEEQPV